VIFIKKSESSQIFLFTTLLKNTSKVINVQKVVVGSEVGF